MTIFNTLEAKETGVKLLLTACMQILGLSVLLSKITMYDIGELILLPSIWMVLIYCLTAVYTMRYFKLALILQVFLMVFLACLWWFGNGLLSYISGNTKYGLAYALSGPKNVWSSLWVSATVWTLFMVYTKVCLEIVYIVIARLRK